MRVTATPIKASQLQAGDLFSSQGQAYWDSRDPSNPGEKLYLKTEAPVGSTSIVYRVVVTSDPQTSLTKEVICAPKAR